MTDLINTLGFIFSESKTIIKSDRKNKYNAFCCNNNYCVNNLCKVCVFKLEKENFISSTLSITTSNDDLWENFKNNIETLLNAFFIISLTKCNTLHSFNAKLVRCKRCDCCDAILLYFKYNIVPYNLNTTQCNKCIPIINNTNIPNTSNIIVNYWPSSQATDNNKPQYNNSSDFAYLKLKSGTYSDIKFFYNDKYASTLCFKPANNCNYVI